jgi:hypothetical protein
MNDALSSTEDLIRAANPVRTSDVPGGESPAARRLLASLPAPAPSRARRRSARPARVALGTVAVAGLTAGIVTAVTMASPAPPPGPARPAAAGSVPASVTGSLRDLVLAAYRQRAVPVPRPGQFQYTDSVSLQLTEFDEANGLNFSVRYSQHRQIWLGPDGAGRLVQSNTDPRFPTPADRANWVASGSPSLAESPVDTTLSDKPMDLTKLPTDPARLARLIASRKIEGGPPGPAEDFVQVGDLLRETSAPPALRAALFQVAVGIPGVQVVRGAADHDGRPGIALERDQSFGRGRGKVTVERSELIFDPATSALLGEEYGAVSPATGALTDISWTVYLRSLIVDSNTSVTPAS